jgi:multiple sugar transport system substrate-binding protein
MVRFADRRPSLRARQLAAILLLAALALGGCNISELPVPVDVPTPTPFSVEVAIGEPTPTPVPEAVRLRYAMWDANQVPAYAACAEQFMAEHPHITIEIEQTPEERYWDKLRADMASGQAPDVFVNHLKQLPDLAAADQLFDLEPLVDRDQLDDEIYIGRLPRMWMRAGMRYGWPKDWDTVALVYNLDLLTASGVATTSLNDLTWNPEDGGAFEVVLARLTLDANGNDGLSPDFDPAQVTRYGMTMAGVDGGGAFGQTQWSGLAAGNGFRFTDYMFADYYRYDDPALSETFQWYQRLIGELGYHAPFDEIAARDGRQIFLDGEAALIADGSWMIRTYVEEAPFAVGFAPLPVGPHGRRSMFNGLADSIWNGTPHSETAWQWVKHLGSVDCQLLVGEQGVVFPAIQSGVDRMVAHYDARGVNVRAYTDYLEKGEGQTFFFPVTEHVQEIEAIMQPVVEAIWRSEADPAVALPEANARVNALFEE